MKSGDNSFLQNYTYVYVKDNFLIQKTNNTLNNKRLESYLAQLVGKNLALTLPTKNIEDSKKPIDNISIGRHSLLEHEVDEKSNSGQENKIFSITHLKSILKNIFINSDDLSNNIQEYLDKDIIDISLNIKLKKRNLKKYKKNEIALANNLRHLQDDLVIKTADGQYVGGEMFKTCETYKINTTEKGLLNEFSLKQAMIKFLTEYEK